MFLSYIFFLVYVKAEMPLIPTPLYLWTLLSVCSRTKFLLEEILFIYFLITTIKLCFFNLLDRTEIFIFFLDLLKNV